MGGYDSQSVRITCQGDLELVFQNDIPRQAYRREMGSANEHSVCDAKLY